MTARLIVFVVVVLLMLVISAQTRSTPIVQLLVERKLCLADLRNEWLEIVFPEELRGRLAYKRPESEYVYSIIAPGGRALFAVRRTFYSSSPPKDTLLRRTLGGSIGPEEAISIPFSAIFQCAVSPNEKLILLAGRLSESPTARRDGIYLVERGNGNAEFVAPYAGGGLNESIRSLNVNDRGDMIVYEDRGSIVELAGPREHWAAAGHAGKFPALLPDGRTYVYSDNGWLIENNGKERRPLFLLPEIAGAIRASPDGRFIAFGMSAQKESGITQLRICELSSGDCVDGPKHSERIAGRETFWIQR